jgi:TDG/mug DNA glycosylase family protein
MLPDYLGPALDIVFVGINPGGYSDHVGHYFARKQNRFWTALYQSGLVTELLTPEDDYRMLEFGYGLTDIVKRATPNASHVADSEFVEGAPILRAKLELLKPRVICFNGKVGYQKAFDRRATYGPQNMRWGSSHLYVVPSTSPLNAHFRLFEIVDWFKRLKNYAVDFAHNEAMEPQMRTDGRGWIFIIIRGSPCSPVVMKEAKYA